MLGWAAKASWFETTEEMSGYPEWLSPEATSPASWTEKKSFNIYKDPITDDGTKKSLKGLCQVYEISNPHISIEENGYFAQTECSPEEEAQGLLQVIYEDGKFYNLTTLSQIRERIKKIS